MRKIKSEGGVSIWLSVRDTENWGSHWPCSTLRGKRVFAQFERNGDLVDLAINGGKGNQDVDGWRHKKDFVKSRPDIGGISNNQTWASG